MRNLRIVHRSVLLSPHALCLTAVTWDVAANSVICAFGPTKNDSFISLKRWYSPTESKSENELEHIASWDALCPLPDVDCDKILSLHHFPDSSTLCLVLAGGDIIVVRESPLHGEEKIEIVGSVDAGIHAAAWSPDEELLAIATRGDTLIYMTRDYETVANLSLAPDDLKVSKHVSVGWGKAETQFRGKGAKALRDPTMPEKIDEGTSSNLDDGRSTISWRGDGAYVALNTIQNCHRRVIRVYSREGTLDGVSEPVDGLEGALSWRPAGNLLAAIQRLEKRVQVIFFERNGLRHGQFLLRLSQEEVNSWGSSISLTWNVDSSILAVCFRDRCQIWTMGNYHYYLKQEVSMLSMERDSQPIALLWHPEEALQFLAGTETGIQRIEIASHFSVGATSPPNDHGIVAVIDGRNLKLTPLRLANVPPPMALHELTLESNIIDVAVLTDKSHSKSTFIALLDHNNLTIYDWNVEVKPSHPPEFYASIALATFATSYPDRSIALLPRQLLLLDHERISILVSGIQECHVHVLNLQSKVLGLNKSVGVPFAQGILSNSSAADGSLYLHGIDGQLVQYGDPVSNSDGAIEYVMQVKAKLPTKIRQVVIMDVQDPVRRTGSQESNGHTTNIIAFGLALDGSLFAGSHCLTRDCTSFVVTSAHLIFTTTQHLLKFVHIGLAQDLEVPPDSPETDERCRSIEHGARLVTAIPSASAVILQMPRGNLETIYPRALVLADIRRNIDEGKYKKAFLACRTHRVDMNIIHDHSPRAFIANSGLFVDQIAKVEYIDLFLSQLREEDVSNTMYRETLRPDLRTNSVSGQASKPPGSDANGKVNRICNAFLDVLRHRKSTNLQNIITAHICKIPPDLEAGLTEVAKLQRESPDDAERAVEHICFLADVNRLFDHALGLYDLALVLLVAQQSQKDPREYLPFLQNLQGMSVLRRQHTIDDHLGRWTKALRWLHDLHAFEDFKIYMVTHKLYDDALRLYRYQEDRVKDIMGLYADHLIRESRYKDAGIAYEFLCDYVAASEAYRLAHLWKESLSCAGLALLSQSRIQSLAKTISDTLVEQKDFYGAAMIHLDYLHDIEASCRIFCKGYHFADAIRVLSLHKRNDLLDLVVDVGLVEAMATITELLAECKAQLNAQVPRLGELRIKKLEEPMAFFDGDVNEGADIPDNVSLAATDASTTGGSLFTRYTNRTGTVGTNATRKTSKNKRREERKRARGKKGSVYEEEYLVNSIGRLIDRISAVSDDVERLVVGLMRRGMRERAMAVEIAMVEITDSCKASVNQVFQTETKELGMEQQDLEVGADRPTGGEGVMWDSMTQATRDPPMIRHFEKLPLLGVDTRL